MCRRQLCAWMTLIAAALTAGGCGSTVLPRHHGGRKPAATAARRQLHWTGFVHATRILDVAGPRGDGSMVLAANGRLLILRPSGRVDPYPGSYASPGGEEPYIAVAPKLTTGCSFHPGTVYAIRLRSPRGVVAISRSPRVRQFARIATVGQIDGIAFDSTGRFGHRLLITVRAGPHATVIAIDCHGTPRAITRHAPNVEGGIAVAPAGFGRFAGDLIAPDENGGRIFAVTPRGRTVLLARSGLPHGGDIGVESAGFVVKGADALVADRLTPGNRHPGDDLVLRIRAAALAGAGVRPGDLLVVTEGGARTDDVHCGPLSCRVHHVADGPVQAHGEGHVGFMPARS